MCHRNLLTEHRCVTLFQIFLPGCTVLQQDRTGGWGSGVAMKFHLAEQMLHKAVCQFWAHAAKVRWPEQCSILLLNCPLHSFCSWRSLRMVLDWPHLDNWTLAQRCVSFPWWPWTCSVGIWSHECNMSHAGFHFLGGGIDYLEMEKPSFVVDPFPSQC